MARMVWAIGDSGISFGGTANVADAKSNTGPHCPARRPIGARARSDHDGIEIMGKSPGHAAHFELSDTCL